MGYTLIAGGEKVPWWIKTRVGLVLTWSGIEWIKPALAELAKIGGRTLLAVKGCRRLKAE